VMAQTQYGDQTYWEARFKGEDEFDWYHKWAPELKTLLENHGLAQKKSGRILVVGCGNSSMSRDMCDDGYEHIENIDFSVTVIQKMKAKNAARNMTWYEMKVTDMHMFADEIFDAVIDKGCIDCVMCAPQSTANCTTALENISRVLKPGGKFYSISYSFERKDQYDAEEIGWAGEGIMEPIPKPCVSNVPFEGDPNYYLYVCTRK